MELSDRSGHAGRGGHRGLGSPESRDTSDRVDDTEDLRLWEGEGDWGVRCQRGCQLDLLTRVRGRSTEVVQASLSRTSFLRQLPRCSGKLPMTDDLE